MEFSTRSIEFEKCIIRAQLWDTAGQERFESMTRAYFRDAVGAALIYDITDKQSFINAKGRWLTHLKNHGHESMKIVLGKQLYGFFEFLLIFSCFRFLSIVPLSF
jgi:GTPase SAR1 family protein